MHTDYLIVGLGNTLRGDDGAGWALAERLAAALADNGSAVQVRLVQQLLPELAAEIEEVKPAVLLIADCTVQEDRPLLRRLDSAHAPAPGSLLRSHGLLPADLLALAQRLYGFEGAAWLAAVPGFDFAHREGLSAAASAEIEEAAPLLLAQILAAN